MKVYLEVILLSFRLPGRLLDATHQYMHIFLLAGCQVTLSAFVLTLGNFLCLRQKQKDRRKTKSREEEGLHQEEELREDDKEEQKGGENGQAGEVIVLKELGNEEKTQL